MAAQPWFLRGVSERVEDRTNQQLRLDDQSVPSKVLKLVNPWDDLVWAEFDVPDGMMSVELIGSIDSSETGFVDILEHVVGDAMAITFEIRLGEVELPHAEVVAGVDHKVGAVVLGLRSGDVDEWQVLETVEETFSGDPSVWVCDSNAWIAFAKLKMTKDPKGDPLGFYVTRTVHDQQGIALVSHSKWPTAILTIARSGDGRGVDGRSRVWIGLDSDKQVARVAIDLAYAARQVERLLVDDPWHLPVSGCANVHEDANLSNLIGSAEPFWVSPYFPCDGIHLSRETLERFESKEFFLPDAAVELLGHLPLAGQLIVGDPALPQENGFETGVVVQPGMYPVFRSADSEYGVTALMVRLDSGVPLRWSYAPGVVGNKLTDSGHNTGLWSESVDQSLFGKRPPVDNRMIWNGVGSGMLSVLTHDDSGAVEIYVGYDESELPIAVVIDVFGFVSGDDTYLDSAGS